MGTIRETQETSERSLPVPRYKPDAFYSIKVLRVQRGLQHRMGNLNAKHTLEKFGYR